MTNLQDSINGVLAMLPADGSKMKFEDFRDKVLKSGIESAQAALAVISKQNLARLEILPREGLQTDPQTKKVIPGQARPHVLFFISRKLA